MKRTIISTLIFLGVVTSTQALEISGVKIPETCAVQNQNLILNGAGLRTVTILHVKAYVAAFYSPAPLRTPDDVFQSTGPLRFDFTFVRDFDKEDVHKAWTLQFKESSSHQYPGWEKDVSILADSFGALKIFGLETIEISGDKIRITDQGEFKGEINSADFRKSFLSLWFGSNPVPRMKPALLGPTKIK